MEFPDMDKLLDQLEESSEDFVKSNSTHILDEKTFSKDFRPIDLVQRVDDLVESNQLNDNLSEPNDSLPEKLSVESVSRNENEKIIRSHSESPPLTTLEGAASSTAEQCLRSIQPTVQKIPEDQPLASEKMPENSHPSILENKNEAVPDEPSLEEIVPSRITTKAPTNHLTLIAMTDQSKDESIELGVSDTLSVQPTILSEQQESQATDEISVVPEDQIESPTAVNLLPGALLADINEIDQEVAVSQGSKSDQANELTKEGLEAPIIGTEDRKTNEYKFEQQTKHFEIDEETSLSGSISSPEGETCHQAEKSEKIEVDRQPNDEDTLFKDESAAEERAPEEMVSRNDLYEEIERMEKLILAEKQALLLSGNAPSTPPIICFGKDATILTSSTVNKNSLTSEEKTFLTPTCHKLMAEPTNSCVDEMHEEEHNQAETDARHIEQRPTLESSNGEVMPSIHLANDGGDMDDLIAPRATSYTLNKSSLTTQEISLSDTVSERPNVENVMNKIQTKPITESDSKDSLTEEHTLVQPEIAENSLRAVHEDIKLDSLTKSSDLHHLDDTPQTPKSPHSIETPPVLQQSENVQTSSSIANENNSDDLETSVVSPETSYQPLEESSEQCIIQGIEDTECELAKMVDEEVVEVVSEITENEEISNLPSTSSATNLSAQVEIPKRSVVASTHNFDISVINSQIKLTESELQLAKVKPYWIPDEECSNCMLCSAKFTIVNRRHHCRSCGRVLCGGCCINRRILPYMEVTDRKQRVCTPCNTTLDMIEEYEKNIAAEMAATNTIQQNVNDFTTTQPNLLNSSNIFQSENIFSSTNNQPSSSSLNEPKKVINTRKKSVLKVRLPQVVNATEEDNASPALAGDVPTPVCTSSTSIVLPSPTVTPAPSTSLLAQPKRSVTFRDGVNPGDSPAAGEDSKEGDVPDSGRLKKNPKKISRRTMEKRADEEHTSFLAFQPESLYLTNAEAQITRLNTSEVLNQLISGTAVNIVIKRNLYVVVQKTKLALGESSKKIVICYSTRGFNAIGVDEILLVMESREVHPQDGKSENEEVESRLEEEQQDLIEVLLQLEDIFSTCLNPSEDTLDDRMGIRRCCNRMGQMYITKNGKLAGIEATAIYLHRPLGQLFGDLPIPSSSFFIGTLLKREEIAWAIAIPNRVLYGLGKQSSYYPIPLINDRQRKAVFSSDQTQASVLKVFNDFRNWNYRMAKLPGSYVSLSDSKTEIVIPEWTAEEVKSIVETNRNMLGWALDFNQQADSHLVCEQNLEMGSFQTHIFSNHNTKRKITGATFIIFDGALKNSSEQFELRVVEDGLVVRMQPDTMAELIKALLAAENFTLQSANMHLEVAFQPSQQPFLQHAQGALRSPIDGHNLMGKYQYGLVLNRQFRSQNFVPTATEWALRLATVINMEQGKFPSVLQPKFFEVCEQIVVIVSHTIQPFIAVLVAAGQRRICLRVRVDDECAIYDSEQWSQLEDQHYYWTNSLDEQMIPFLYSICSWVPNGLHIELHLNIISTRPLPMELALGKDIGF